ncbi:SDR family NAD(P)-dependent oxidoreductase [Gryllotalpicola reticulitermitis]|uniref:SDR family NAD(P)-dependent oxidoreductase n=1 Tax=Gryllotalpicola reticulitermitis TaxID=1184153 RepID=A0ABV8Q3P4_9MICO
MQLDLTDRVVIITGAARGIGRGIAEAFIAEGARVAALDRSFDADAGLDASDRLLPLECDVTDASSTAAVIEQIVARFGRVDVLVNNAGINVDAPFEQISAERFRAVMDVNVTGTFLMAQAVAPIMKAQRSGRIINAASFAAIVPAFGGAAYAASKAAVVQLTRVLAGELGPWGVTVNCYAPGMVPTGINGFADMAPAAQERLLDTLTLRRWEAPDDVAKLLVFLASDAAAYLTGALIDISGGKLATQIPAKAYEAAALGSAE